MRKYIFIFKSEVMSNITYVANILTNFIGYFLILYIFLNLWQFIYSNPSEVINGYTINQMIWYVIVTELIWSIMNGRNLCRKISDDVKGGNIAYNINKPYSYIGYILSSHLGDCAISGILYTILCIFVGLLFLGSFPKLTIIGVISVFISIILALIINTLLITCIGLFSFFIEDSKPFYWLYSKFILVLGVIFPIEFFPVWARGILNYSPIYAVSYGPAKLFVDFSYNNLLLVILSQVFYVIIAYLLCKILYSKGVKNINVNGG